MVCLTYCQACQFGFHEDHVQDFAPAPPGVMGGFRCPCEGECVTRPRAVGMSEGVGLLPGGFFDELMRDVR